MSFHLAQARYPTDVSRLAVFVEDHDRIHTRGIND
jgi:hypothetical protein